MNQWLAQMYGTAGASASAPEETTKLASAELFAKLAAQNNIDLSQLSPAQVGELYAQVFPEEAAKLAEESSEEEEKEEKEEKEEESEEKEAAAVAYWQEKRAAQEKFAEADLMGRVMAHSFTQELDNIQKEALSKTEIGMKLRHAGGKAKEWLSDAASARTFRQGRQAMENTKSDLGEMMRAKAVYNAVPKGQREKAIKDLRNWQVGEAADMTRKGALRTGTLYGGGAAALGGGAALATRGGKDKKASFDELAALGAVKIAQEAGYAVPEAQERIGAVFTLGLGDSEKVAAMQSPDDAVQVRSLEFLEAAGYPVNWAAVLGG